MAASIPSRHEAHHAIPIARPGNAVMAAGVSAGIDPGLSMAREIEGWEQAEVTQLLIEHAPQPSFNCGHVIKLSTQTQQPVKTIVAEATPQGPEAAHPQDRSEKPHR
jgi:hypothetical protein